jgi:tetratricopeptide (TPR) repeat protein
MDATAAGPLDLARHHLRVGRPDRALQALERADSDELEGSEFWRLRASALFDLRRWKDGAAAARDGLARDADNVALLELLAICSLESGKKKEAEQALRDALALSPFDPSLLSNWALLLARKKRYDEAREAVARALQVDPESLQVLRTRAQVAVMAKDPMAAEYSRELLASDPDGQATHLVAGNAALRDRRIDAGFRHYVEAARLDPSDRQVAWIGRRSRAYLGRAGAPLRLLWRLGPRRVQVAVILLSIGLAIAGLADVRLVLVLGWLGVVVYGWLFRVVLRARYGKEPD